MILVSLVSQFAVLQFGFVPSVKAQEKSSVVNALETDINWTEFWQTFKTYAAWDLEWLDRTIWRSVKSDLTIVLNYSKPNHCKVSLVFDASHNAAYRLTFVINRVVTDYVQRLDKFQYELTYDDVTIVFDWTDCASINGLVFTHGLIDDVFWFRIRRNNVPLGSHVVIDPSVIASTSTNYAVSYSNQRKTFTAYSKHWVFFSNGSYAVYYYSSDGITWIMGNDSPLRAATYGYMFSVWWTGDESGSYINFAYAYSAGALNQPLLFRRGALLANSTISWDAAEQTVLAADASLYYAYPFVCMGIDLYPWIGYRRYEKNVATTPYVVRSSSYSGSWATPSGFPYQLSTWTSTSWIVTICPLTNTQYSGAKAVFYSNSSSKINCKTWTAVVWNPAVQTSSSISGLGGWYLSASAIGNITHLVFLTSLNNKKYTYFNFTSNTFASETSLGIGSASDNAPVISVNSTSNDIWVMWIDSPSSIHQFYYKLYNNSISSWGSDTNYFNETVSLQHDKLISPYRFTGKFGIAYLNGTAAYSVNFVLVEVVVITKAWYDVSSWTASLTTKTWSSGMSWSFNLPTRQWRTINYMIPSTVATSESTNPVGFPSQRKGFYAPTSKLYWVFFCNETRLVYCTSADGTTWSSPIDIRAALYGDTFSIWFDDTYLHYAYAYSGSLKYRRGTPDADGLITWSADEQSVSTACNVANEPFVSVDSSGYVWIAYADIDIAPLYPYVIKSQYNNGSWGTTPAGFPYLLSSTGAIHYGIVVLPLSSGKMLAIYAEDSHTLKERMWNGSDWGSEKATVSSLNDAWNHMASAVSEGDDVHVVFLTNVTDIVYVKYTYSSDNWGTETTVQSSVTDDSSPVLSINTTTSVLYCFWAGSPSANHIYYKAGVGLTWDADPTDWRTEPYSFKYEGLTCFYHAYGDSFGLIYSAPTTLPTNVKFAWLRDVWTFSLVALEWHTALAWSLSLLARMWQSPMSFAFNLLAMTWINIATWGIDLLTMAFHDVATYAFDLVAMAWHDLNWLFTLLPLLPEWVNVAVWIFHLLPAEWIFPFIWIIMAGFIGLCCLVVSAKPQKKRETENV